MSDLRLLVRQIRYENRAFWRNPAAAFFTFVFPLIFMVVFNAIFGDSDFGQPGLKAASFFTPAIVAFSVVNACYTNLAMSVTTVREQGILKRVRGTPLPEWVYLLARIGLSVLVGLLLVVVVALFGALVYGVPFPWERLPQLVVVLLVGSACFCALGLAISGVIPNEGAAPALVNATILPLLFISDVFIKLPPANTLAQLGNLFPVRHLALALQSIWTPEITGALNYVDVAWVAGWAVVGLLLAMRTFRWDPRG
jgi:ABC-2 type transport system permease protein